MNNAAGRPHFAVLDSLRGVCAVMVVLFHLTVELQWNLGAFVANAFLFVDFFFVLSGFVIAFNYGDRLAQGYSLRDFTLLRLGRIFPLYAAVLFVFLLIELVLFVYQDSLAGLGGRSPFEGEFTVSAFLGSLAMVQVLGFWDHPVWNAPGWSIATEFWAYLVFALVCMFAKTRYAAAMLVVAILCAGVVLLARSGEYDLTSSWSLPRCLFGFGLGVGVARLRQGAGRTAGEPLPPGTAFVRGTLVEVANIAACVLFLSFVQVPYLIIAPILFATTIWVFSFERGAISRLLHVRPLVWLGLLSYSVYLTHMLLVSRLPDAAKVLAQLGGPAVFTDCGSAGQCIPQGSWQAAAYLLVFAILVLIASVLGYFVIEQPFRRWSRAKVQAAAARRKAAAQHPAGAATLELSGS